MNDIEKPKSKFGQYMGKLVTDPETYASTILPIAAIAESIASRGQGRNYAAEQQQSIYAQAARKKQNEQADYQRQTDEEDRRISAVNRALEKRKIDIELKDAETKAKTNEAERARLESFRSEVAGGADPYELWRTKYDPVKYAELKAAVDVKPVKEKVTAVVTMKDLGVSNTMDALTKIDEMNQRYPDYKFQLRPDQVDPFALAGYKNELSKDANTPGEDKKRDVATKAMSIINSMKSHPGFKGAVGAKGASQAFGIMKEPLAGSSEAGFYALDASLRSLLTLENLGMLKGMLSDKDMQVLQSAATTLNTDAPEEDYIKALDEIRTRMEKIVTGTNQPPVVKPSPIPKAKPATPAVDIPTFNTPEEAEASGVRGIVIINGRKARIE